MAVTASGLGSGLDIASIVSQLVAAERAPTASRIDRREANLQAELSGVGSLKSALSDFRGSLSGLKTSGSFQAFTAGVGNKDLLTATAGITASAGSYSVEVQQLASAHKIASGTYASLAEPLGTGTLTLETGTYVATPAPGTFTANGAPKAITIDATNNTLGGIRDAINAAGAGVRANIINDGTGYRLVLSSETTGASNSIRALVTDGDGNNTDALGLSALAYDPAAAAGSGKNLEQKVAAQNATVVIDGISVSSATNTLSSAITGVTLTLAKADVGNPTTLTVARDTAGVVSKVQAFVTAYNKLADTLNSLGRADPEGGTTGVLVGDAAVRGIEGQLRRFIVSNVEGGVTGFGNLSSVGISFGRDGKLSLDSSKLTTTLEANPDAVASLFARHGRTSDGLVRFGSSTSSSKAGSYAVNLTQFARGELIASGGVTSLNVTAGMNDTLAVKINGTQSGTITLTPGAYASEAALAQEIQARINADPALVAAGVSAQVRYDATAGRLVLNSSSFGASSTVEITAVGSTTSADFGLSVAVGTAGQDAAGSIGGVAATASDGTKLTGTGSAEGIVLEFLGGATGDRGTVTLSGGLISQLDSFLDGLVKTGGTLGLRTDSLKDRIDDISDERVQLDRRIAQFEDRIRAQFEALDRLVAGLRSTGDFLTAQLATLPGFVDKN